ncbi:MAG: aminoacyltransferase, partial [Chloroflexi bacterium]|nr:aminoacyltransferase [Chloroflexota bacterium]
MPQLAYIIEADRWDAFVCAHPCGHFLQTWAWGALKEQFGWQPARVGLCDGEQLVAGAQILFRKFPLGAMGYIPKGPISAPDSPHWHDWLDALRQVARQHGAFFLRMEPEWEQSAVHPLP